MTELLRGERLPQENQLSPSTERSVRDAFREFGLRFKRHQRLLIAAVSILGVLLLLWLLLFLSPFRAHKADHREVTAAEAATLDPTCLITREEFDLLRRMSEDPELIALLREAATTDGISLEAAPEITGRYRALLPIDGQPAEFFSIQAFSYGDLYVLYRLEDRSWSLTLTPEGTVTKHSVVYEYEDEFSLPNSSSISNTDNLTFQYRGPQQLDRPGTLRLLLDHIF